MPVSAIIMLVLACIILYGGLAYCISRAIKKREKTEGGG
ncbi:MAG: methionine/alanine import family NSS transporter small subunit [candidate division WOR-3 bacterium]|nr:MAG: methionine/alanine import family NSS transporter small subunit [candidate division WOR-3 bacterium]